MPVYLHGIWSYQVRYTYIYIYVLVFITACWVGFTPEENPDRRRLTAKDQTTLEDSN